MCVVMMFGRLCMPVLPAPRHLLLSAAQTAPALTLLLLLLLLFRFSYEYDGDATCAADGMCQEKCPVKINTGESDHHDAMPALQRSTPQHLAVRNVTSKCCWCFCIHSAAVVNMPKSNFQHVAFELWSRF
jgi:hypothetical protein